MAGTRRTLWALWLVILTSGALIVWNIASFGFYESTHWNVALFLVITIAGIIKRRLSRSA
jgi:hypothetical protein